MRWLGKGGRRLMLPSKGGLSDKLDWDRTAKAKSGKLQDAARGGLVGVMEAATTQQQRSERERKDVSREGRESGFGGGGGGAGAGAVVVCFRELAWDRRDGPFSRTSSKSHAKRWSQPIGVGGALQRVGNSQREGKRPGK